MEGTVLDAAWEQPAECGYPAFSIEGVAARARTSTPVLYRRWSWNSCVPPFVGTGTSSP
ncbi:helix-turn-helix domain-containing protein [Streptomyces sp. NPDC093085]|uniref:helix-turn-helix domain-containing protein n=1 Tax=Streptomyces sp. NPDC093085 TaxID=3155068 RepID=UPI003429B68B